MGMWVVVVGGVRGDRAGAQGRWWKGQACGPMVGHRQAIVRQTDTSDPDPAEVPTLMCTCSGRMDLLYSRGHVVNMLAKDGEAFRRLLWL